MRLIIFTIICITFLVGTGFAQDTLYSETFANGTLENPWYAGFSGNNMQPEFMSGNPSGDNWVGSLGNDLSGGGVGQAFSGDSTWTDFYYEAWVYLPVDSALYYGIEFRIDSSGNTSGYNFVARLNPNYGAPVLKFRSRVSASPTTLKEWSSSDVPGGLPTTSGWHKMAARAVGDQFWLYFDGQELPDSPIQDTTFANGWIGAYLFDFAVSPLYLYIDDVLVTQAMVSIDENENEITSHYQLHQNFPNPFNPTTTINFELPKTEFVRLTVFNNLGQKIKQLVLGKLPAGNQQVTWNGRNDNGQEVPAGIYYYQLQAGDYKAGKKMMLVK